MKPMTEMAIEALMDRESSMDSRKRAAGVLASLNDVEAVPALAVLLTEIEPALIADVRSALSALDATHVLAKRLDNPSPAARQDVVRLLGYQLDTEAVPVLLGALEDPDAKVREEAAGALIPLRAGPAVTALVRHLADDADSNVRMAAAQALGEIADDASFAALENAVEREPDAFARVIVELAHGRAERLRSGKMMFAPPQKPANSKPRLVGVR